MMRENRMVGLRPTLLGGRPTTAASPFSDSDVSLASILVNDRSFPFRDWDEKRQIARLEGILAAANRWEGTSGERFTRRRRSAESREFRQRSPTLAAPVSET
ncbi:hypothetical protein CP556_23175 [Natrinema sp. CBA1119]|nr:hypothetical protein CP556_23175 [Natrinema sp. CBA1119]